MNFLYGSSNGRLLSQSHVTETTHVAFHLFMQFSKAGRCFLMINIQHSTWRMSTTLLDFSSWNFLLGLISTMIPIRSLWPKYSFCFVHSSAREISTPPNTHIVHNQGVYLFHLHPLVIGSFSLADIQHLRFFFVLWLLLSAGKGYSTFVKGRTLKIDSFNLHQFSRI